MRIIVDIEAPTVELVKSMLDKASDLLTDSQLHSYPIDNYRRGQEIIRLQASDLLLVVRIAGPHDE